MTFNSPEGNSSTVVPEASVTGTPGVSAKGVPGSAGSMTWVTESGLSPSGSLSLAVTSSVTGSLGTARTASSSAKGGTLVTV